MKFNIFILTLLGSVVLQAGDATEQVNDAVIPIAVDIPHYYIGGGISDKTMKDDSTDEEFESIDISLVTGYRWNKYLGVEARYARNVGDVEYSHGNTNNSDDDSYDSDFEYLGGYVRLSYPIDSFTPYALLGYAETTMDNLAGDSRSDGSFSWGLGFTYSVTSSWNIFVDYLSLYDDKGFDNRATNDDIYIDTFTLGVQYAF